MLFFDNNYEQDEILQQISHPNFIITPSLENLISFQHQLDQDDNEEDKGKKFSLKNFKNLNLSKFFEDTLYYCCSPETLKNYKRNKEEEKNYEFFKDFDCEEFLYSQKKREKTILSISKSNPYIKKNKLGNFNNTFCTNSSFIEKNADNTKKMINANLLRRKMEELGILCVTEKDEKKLIGILGELQEVLKNNEINIESLGLIHFNFIENNISLILNIILNKIKQKNDINILNDFIFICLKLFEFFKSSQLFFFIIELLKENQQNIKLENKELFQIVPNNCLNFEKISTNINYNLINDLNEILANQDILKKDGIIYKLDLGKHWTLIYGDFLFFLFKSPYKKIEKVVEESKDSRKDNLEKEEILYLKININEKRIINIGEINLLNNTNKEKIIDINISIKDEYIYLFYIIEENNEKDIKYKINGKIFSQNSMLLIKENEIELVNSFIPTKLFCDGKFVYCFSKRDQVLMIKKKYKLNKYHYINCSIQFFDKDIKIDNKKTNIESLQMYNSLCINNIFIIDNLEDKKKYMGKIINKQNNNFILNIYELNNSKIIGDSIINVAYGDNRFVITKYLKNKNQIFYNITSNGFNDLIDKGIAFLPFDSEIYFNNYETSNNIYEYLLSQYSSILNICGNFDLVNNENVKYLTKYPISLCFNFSINSLKLVIKNIIEDDNYNNIKLFYIIILKQIICSLYNSELFQEEYLDELLPYFNRLIKNNINKKENKNFNKILKEIIVITSYLNKKSFVEINDIKFVFEENYNNINFKTKVLLIELLLNQKTTQKEKELFEIIIQIEKRYFLNIFNAQTQDNNLFDLVDYPILKSLMIKASETLFNLNINMKNELFELIPILSNNIIEIFVFYNNILKDKNKSSLLYNFSFIYNSFIFRSFYFIVELLITNKILLNDKDKIIDLYKTILTLDNNDIQYDYYDMDNIIEIQNPFLGMRDIYDLERGRRRNNLKKISIPIKMNKEKNIIIRTNKSLNNLFNKIIKIELIQKNKNSSIVNLGFENEQLFHNINEIKIEIINDIVEILRYNINRQEINLLNNIIKNNFFIYIIPLKDGKTLNEFKNNDDNKFLLLIQKTIIHYLLTLFEDIHSKIDEYNSNKIVNNHSKLFQSEILKFLSISDIEQMNSNNDIKLLSPFIEISNQLIDTINNSLKNDKNNFNIFNKDLIAGFKEANKNLKFKKLKFFDNYEKNMKLINQLSLNKKNQKILINFEKYQKLFDLFKKDLSKKNNILNQYKENKNVKLIIEKIFLFSIKYYNCFLKLNYLLNEIENLPNNENYEETILRIKKNANYKLFYSFYESSSKMKLIYGKQKNNFDPSNFQKDEEKYFNDIFQKIDFIYNNVIPISSDDNKTIPNTSIISNILNIIENKDLDLNEIIKYSQIQSINSQIKLLELIIINNLLSNLNNEKNVSFLLNLICGKIRQAQNKLNSFFDKTLGVDYFIMDKLKCQFHFLLHILSYKNNILQEKYSTTTRISLTESLMWKIRGRNFPMLLEVIKTFEQIKSVNNDYIKNNLFTFEHDNYYNIKYISIKQNIDIKFKVFKILVFQIINKIKDILINDSNVVFLERNPSNISDIDYKAIFNEIMSYFVDIKPDCIYYYDLTLFFYKNLLNSSILFKFILSNYPNIIAKIINIIFDKDILYTNKDKRRKFTKLIMIKLLGQILEIINEEEEIINFSKLLNLFNDKKYENPFIYLYKKLLDELNNNYGNAIIYKYYNKLLLICLNKIFKIEKDENKLKQLFENNISTIILFLFSEYSFDICENTFINKTKYTQKFENEALFNSKNKEKKKYGKTICYINYCSDCFGGLDDDDDYAYRIGRINNIQSIKNYLKDNSTLYFDKSMIEFHIKKGNKNYKNILVIPDYSSESQISNISNVKIIPFSNISIIKENNNYQKEFIKNYSKIILNIINKEIKNDLLNEKGKFFLLKIISNLINYININSVNILEFIWNYFIKNKDLENNYIFMSLEFIENIMNKNLDIYNFCHQNIYNNIVNNDIKSLFNLFKFIIKNKSIGIYSKLTNKINWYKNSLNIPIYEINFNQNMKNIYCNYKEFENLSFFKSHQICSNELIKNDSILFSHSIKESNDLSILSKLIEKNKENIKAIFVTNISENISQSDLIAFINSNHIPLYAIKDNVFKTFTDFFIEGKGQNYIYLKDDIEQDKYHKNESNDNIDIVDIYKFNFSLSTLNEPPDSSSSFKGDINELIIFENNKNKIYEEIINESNIIYNMANIKLIKRLIYEILYIDSIKISEIKIIYNPFKDIIDIFESLCMEYYFNISMDLSNEFLKDKLSKYLNNILSKDIKNDWLVKYTNYLEIKNNPLSYLDYLKTYNIASLNSEKTLLKQYLNSFNNIAYDKILFLSKYFKFFIEKEYFIILFLDSIKNIIENLIKEKNEKEKNKNEEYVDNVNDYATKNNNYFETLFLSEIIKILYEYYIQNNPLEKINDLYLNYFSSNNIQNNMKVLIDKYIDMNNYFNENNDEEILRRIVRNKPLDTNFSLIEYTFKYFDFCLILYLKENKRDLFEFWSKSNNQLFNFFCNYSILSIDKNYDKNDFKEKFSLIGYLTKSINFFYKENEKKEKINNLIFKMKLNEMNEYKIKDNDNFNITIKFNNSNFNKLAVFYKDENRNYFLQDIIDINDNKRKNIDTYLLMYNKCLIFVPLDKITTTLYSFSYSIKNTYNRGGGLFSVRTIERSQYIFDKFKKIDDTPKYSWYLGYEGTNNFIILSEEKNQVYSFNNSTENTKFYLNKNIDIEKLRDNDKIIDLLSGSLKESSLILSENGNIFSIEKNYSWLSNEEKNSKDFPLKITIVPSIKIVSISANNYNSYAIDNNGNLYGIETHNYYSYYRQNNSNNGNINCWVNYPLPPNSKRFLQCAAGYSHLLCLVEGNDGKGKIYSKGFNDYSQCGVIPSNNDYRYDEFITELTQCTGIEEQDFKLIYSYNKTSAAITKSGELYMWGSLAAEDFQKDLRKPTLIKPDCKSPVYIDNISIGNKEIFAICRVFNEGYYTKKIFYLQFKESYISREGFTFILKEIESLNLNSNNSIITPLKIIIGDKKCFVLCVENGNLIKEINERNKNNKDNLYSEIEIIKNDIEKEDILKLKEFYSSDNLIKFIELLKDISNNIISKFIETFDEIKKDKNYSSGKISNENIDYEKFMNYLKDKNDKKDLFLYLQEKEIYKSKIIFYYLIKRIILIEKNLIKYVKANMGENSNEFLQKIILNNIIYLSENLRLEYFNSLLSNLSLTRRYIGERIEENEYDYDSFDRTKFSIIINRFKAKAFYDKFNENSEKIPDIELNETVFGQLFQYFKNIHSKFFIKKKGERLFHVTLEGEQAIDAGGPYHEIISCLCNELQSDYIDLFIKTPNNKNNLGKLRDKYIINPDLNKNIHEKAYEFIGKLMGTAISSGEALNLNLHPIIWKKILDKEIEFNEYETIDHIFFRNTIKKLEEALEKKDNILLEVFDLNFVIKNSKETDIELIEKGSDTKVNLDNLEKFIKLAKEKRMNEFQTQLDYIKKGLFSVIDKNIIQILNWKQLEEMICGKNKLDIDDFKKHTHYHGYKDNDEVIKWFWEWLENSNEETQFKYLKFVSGRTRLSQSGFGFEYTHLITKAGNNNSFPIAHTCFFTLDLPNYESKEILVEKITYAIENCTDISDY